MTGPSSRHRTAFVPQPPAAPRTASRNRSSVPDLLFEDTQEARLAEIAPLLRHPEGLGPDTPLHRLTVLVTDRCNLACTYCKTIPRNGPPAVRRAPGRTFDLAAFARLLETHAGTSIRHVHFTGGEASAVAALPAMIRRARAEGVVHQSLTTNGTLPPARYLALVEAGLSEVRVSLDAGDAAQGDALSGRRGAWDAAVRTLTALGAARRAGAPFFLVVNTVVGLANRRRLPATARFLLELGPDDLKLITEVDGREALGDFPEAGAVRSALEALLAEHPSQALPLLRRKLRTVFATDAIGLEPERRRPPGAAPWRCYVPLTERTVDAERYYPCSVYLREGGAPLGLVSEPAHAQRARTARFVREADCLADPICRRYCLHCTRTFNARANEVAA